MAIVTLGLNHHTAPLAIRERVVFHVERLGEALAELKRLLGAEAAILSTCNRTELYLSGSLEDAQGGAARDWLANYHRVDPSELARVYDVTPTTSGATGTMATASCKLPVTSEM